MEKSLHVQEECEKIRFFGEGEVNGQPVKRMQIDSGASRTIINVCSRKRILEKSLSGLPSGMEQLVNTLLQQLR